MKPNRTSCRSQAGGPVVRPGSGGKAGNRKKRAFTLIEMLVVIAIISVLAGILLPVLSNVRKRSKFASCMNNQRQLGAAIAAYRVNEKKDVYMPTWLTMLYYIPNPQHPYVDSLDTFICPADFTEGRDGGRPDDLTIKTGAQGNPKLGSNPGLDFPNADIDNADGGHNESDGGINCSYLYEFNGEKCDWFPNEPASMDALENAIWNPIKEGPTLQEQIVTWYEAKMVQVKGDKRLDPPEPAYGSYVPVIRCYWHVEWPLIDDHDKILNLIWGGAVKTNQPYWERDYKPDIE